MNRQNQIEDLENSCTQVEMLQYLEGKATETEKQKIEAAMSQSEFFKEAMEGLASIQDPNTSIQLVKEINHQLTQRLHQNKRRTEKINNPFWTITAIITILLLTVLVYLAILFLKTAK